MEEFRLRELLFTSPLAGEAKAARRPFLKARRNAEAEASATSHRRCDPGEGFLFIDRP
jgi:hypothetical protein